MDWSQIGIDNLQAAKLTLDQHPRSAVSRAYYAAHVVLAEVLVRGGYVPPVGRQTQPHEPQAQLIGRYLNGLGAAAVREARSTIRRLYLRRIDADYRRAATVDRATALESVRDASTLFRLLNVR